MRDGPGRLTDMIREIEAFIYREARLLDERRFEEWIELFAPEGYYWVPGAPDQEDPYQSVSIFFDDLPLLKTRIQRIRHPKIHSQEPPTRTCHLVSNIELATGDNIDDQISVFSAQIMTEFRLDKQRSYSGRVRHLLRLTAEGNFEILWKRVDLINCDGLFETLTIPF